MAIRRGGPSLILWLVTSPNNRKFWTCWGTCWSASQNIFIHVPDTWWNAQLYSLLTLSVASAKGPLFYTPFISTCQLSVSVRAKEWSVWVFWFYFIYIYFLSGVFITPLNKNHAPRHHSTWRTKNIHMFYFGCRLLLTKMMIIISLLLLMMMMMRWWWCWRWRRRCGTGHGVGCLFRSDPIEMRSWCLLSPASQPLMPSLLVGCLGLDWLGYGGRDSYFLFLTADVVHCMWSLEFIEIENLKIKHQHKTELKTDKAALFFHPHTHTPFTYRLKCWPSFRVCVCVTRNDQYRSILKKINNNNIVIHLYQY